MYPGNHTDSEILSVPRNLKTRPGAPETHLAYITDDEGELLKKNKPGTPHKGPHDIPNYDSWDWMGSGSTSAGDDPWTDTYSGSGGSDDYGIGNAGEFGGPGISTVDPYESMGTGNEWSGMTSTTGSAWTPGTPEEDLWSAMGGLTQDAGLSNLTPDQLGILYWYGEFGGPGMPEWTGGGSSGGGGGGGYGWGSGGGGRGGYGGGGGRTPGFGGAFKGENPWGQSGIQRAWINQLRGYNRGGIVSLC